MDTYNEDLLLGTWLKGEHLGDIAKIDPVRDMPDYKDLIARLRNGQTLLDLVKAFPGKAATLSHLTADASETLYRLALTETIKAGIKRDYNKLSLDELIKRRSWAEAYGSHLPDPDAGIIDKMHTLMADRAAGKILPYSGLPSLTDWTSGIKRKTLTTISARPGNGKSALALQIAWGVQDCGETVLYFPLEMTVEETAERILTHEGYADSDDLRAGRITDRRTYELGLEVINEAMANRLLTYEGCKYIEDICDLARKHHPAVVIVDQLTQMESRIQTFRDTRERFSYMTKTLKSLAMAENTAVILCAQLNRQADDRRPSLGDHKESGSIEEDSNNIIWIYPDADGDGDPELRDVWIETGKARMGKVDRVQCIFEAPRFKFYEKV